MRRLLLALALMCALGVSLTGMQSAAAEDASTGPIVITVHLANCPIDDVNSDLGLYEACHGNALAGESLSLSSQQTEPLAVATDDAGVGVVEVDLDSIDQVILSADPELNGATAGYAYCADQTDGSVLFDSPLVAGDAIPLFTVNAGQQIVCDWYVYSAG